MSRTFKYRTIGRVFYHDQNTIYKSIHRRLLQSEDHGITWRKFFQIPFHSMIDHLAFVHPWGYRLLRKGYHHININTAGDIGLIYNKNTGIIQNRQLLSHNKIPGSRPLSWEVINDEFVFGEYRSNPERSPIGIFALHPEIGLYKKVEMQGIRHIHGIYQDPYTRKVWISTGDDDHEAALYVTDPEFSRLEKVLYGSQQTRTIKLLFTDEYIYFGSDAPHEVNYLYRMNKSTYKTERLARVGSSVFHGTKVGDWLFFSTAVEPSKVNTTKYAEVWASPDGTSWKCILRFKKDFLPMKYFQYGQVFFPAGPGNGKDLWLSPFATQYSNYSFMLTMKEIQDLYS